MRVVVSGTFDPLHDGHRAVLREAIGFGDDGVVIGLRTDRFAREVATEAREIAPFEERRAAVEEALERIGDGDRDVAVRRLEDDYGVAGEEPGLDGMVTSPLDAGDVGDVNELRRVRGMEPLTGILTPTVRTADGDPIASTRIAAGEIDEHGGRVE